MQMVTVRQSLQTQVGKYYQEVKEVQKTTDMINKNTMDK